MCGEDWIGVLAFLTELAIFKLSEASGCLCSMDYISLSYGLDTSLANCGKLGEAGGTVRTACKEPLKGPKWASSYVRNEEGGRQGRGSQMSPAAYREALGW